MEKHYIDKRIKEELDNLEANPPVEAWLAISDALDGSARKRRFQALLGVAASLITLVAAAFSVWLLMPEPDTPGLAATDAPPPPVMESLGPHVPAPANQPALLADGSEGISVSIPSSGPRQDEPENFSQVYAGSIPASPNLTGRPRQSLFRTDRQYLTEADQRDRQAAEFTRTAPETASANVPRNIRLGMHVIPQQSHRLLAGSDVTSTGIPFETLEESLLSFGMGMRVSYVLSPGLSVLTGVNYMNTGQYVKDIIAYKHPGDIPLYEANRSTGEVYHPQTVITSQGSIRFHDPFHYFADAQSHRVITNKQAMDGNDIKSLRQTNLGLTQVFRYLEIPLIFRYQLAEGMVGFHVKGGMAGNFLMQNDVFAGRNIYQDAIGETYGIRKFNVSAIGGLAFDVALTGRLMFHVEPTAQIFLNPVLQEGLMMGQAFPYSYSIQTGISYGF